MRVLPVGLAYLFDQEGNSQWGVIMAATIFVVAPILDGLRLGAAPYHRRPDGRRNKRVVRCIEQPRQWDWSA